MFVYLNFLPASPFITNKYFSIFTRTAMYIHKHSRWYMTKKSCNLQIICFPYIEVIDKCFNRSFCQFYFAYMS